MQIYSFKIIDISFSYINKWMIEWINESFTFQQIYIFTREINTLEKKPLFYQKRKILFTFPYYKAQIKSSGFSFRKQKKET